jgi:23S rRNA (adenine2030-N6)-methyltransferase
MLSYRHGFHAGNHADVLKHFVLIQLTRYLGQKDKPFWYVDTHAGAGLYALDAGFATKLAENQGGIARLWERDDLPAPLAEYVDLVRSLNPDGQLKAYPGSPWLAQLTMREQDKLRLFELHSTESKVLMDNFRNFGRRVMIGATDGLEALKSVLPPPPRRALVLIDPSYEVRSDYIGVIDALKDGLKRFPTGTYALWYPQLVKPESRQLPEKLKKLPAEDWLHVTLQVSSFGPDTVGMTGSGMFIINPPWTLKQTLQETMPYLVSALGLNKGAQFVLETSDSPAAPEAKRQEPIHKWQAPRSSKPRGRAD